MSWTHRSMIVPAAHVALARELCARLPPGDSGSGMFLTGLSATGTGTPTHWVSAGLIQSEFADLMTSAATTFAMAQAAGIATTQAAVSSLLADSDITPDEPFAALARLGLLIVQEPA